MTYRAGVRRRGGYPRDCARLRLRYRLDPVDQLHGKVAGLLESPSPLWRRVGIAACALHRVDSGRYPSQAIKDPDPRLQARALRAAGETARRNLLPTLRRRIRSEDPACQPWAA